MKLLEVWVCGETWRPLTWSMNIRIPSLNFPQPADEYVSTLIRKTCSIFQLAVDMLLLLRLQAELRVVKNYRLRLFGRQLQFPLLVGLHDVLVSSSSCSTTNMSVAVEMLFMSLIYNLRYSSGFQRQPGRAKPC